jgi:hypothetical protein
MCGICAQAHDKSISDSEVENLSDDIEKGPMKKKKKNCYSVDKKLEAVDYVKTHSIRAVCFTTNNVVCFTTNFVLFVGYYFPGGLNKFSVILNSQNVIEK